MLNQVETMFDDMEKMIKKLKKKQYEENMENFMTAYEAYFLEMETYMSENDPQTAAKEISQVFVDAVKERYEVKGKIKGYVQADLNLFMIYYVFPTILKRDHEHAKLLADTLCETWGSSFKDSKIGYTDYDSLYKSFREKIFGIF
ncbi:MAG: hypothetical protein UEY91_09180 [Lachnospiraceae bacterium]|nr:hypothetical protein [Lachnospiraceae bacterium]